MSTSTPHSQAVAQVQCAHREVRWAPFDRLTDTWRCVECCIEFGQVDAQVADNYARSEAENETLRARLAVYEHPDALVPARMLHQSEAENERLRGQIAAQSTDISSSLATFLVAVDGMMQYARYALDAAQQYIAGREESDEMQNAHTDTLHGLLPAGEQQVPCTCDEPVGVRPVQCLRHQIVRVRP